MKRVNDLYVPHSAQGMLCESPSAGSDNSAACGSACGAGDPKPAACGSACGAGDPAPEKPAACGAACGAGDK